MKQLYLFILFLSGAALHGMSQTATGTITQVPCNNDGIYTVTTSGLSLPLTYTYYLDGTTVVHANVNSATDQLTNFAMSQYGYISCEVTDGSQYAYTQDSYTPAFSFNVIATSPICPATMGTLSATQTSGTSGPFTFTWTSTQTSISYTGNGVSVPLGDYQAAITDQTTGCVLQIGDTSLNIHQESNITAAITTTPASCTNGTATAVASGGIAPYSYLWANGATSATNTGLSQGYYPLTVTDAQGCQSNYLGAEIIQNPQISVNTTVTNATCVQNNGSALAFGSGGTNPYTYSWSNGQTGQNATNLSGGNTYTVVATDVNGCVGTGYAGIGINTPINVSYTSSASQCTSPTGSATLNVSGGTAPYTYSWVSNPSVTTSMLTNVAPGTYAFQVTDAVGCIRTGSVVVSPISSIYASVQTSSVVCPATTGTVNANVSGTNGPFTYAWSNGATTSAISGVQLGSYSCVITDAVGCSVTKSAFLSADSPVSVGVSTVPATCLYNTDGSATPIVSGGTSPYSYAYSNGTTAQNATGLGVNSYYLTVTDASGCASSAHFWITDANTSQSCYCTISGNVFVDGNSNCTYDSGENGVQNIMIHCSGFGYTFTDANGYYSFRVPTGTYTISEQIEQYYPLSACQSNNNSVSVVAASGCNTVVDFSNDIATLHDLKITTANTTTPPIPGNSYQQKIVVRNQGTVTEPGIQLGYEHDSQIPFAGASLPAFTNSTPDPDHYGVQSGFPTLNPNGTTVILVDFNTPTNIPLGTVLNFYDTVANAAPIAANWLLDYTPWNNVNTFQTAVIGSFDPNYKEVTPRGEEAQGYVPMETKEFDYTIHFQNEGTYFAQNIVVTDQLDDDFDWTTFRPGYSDYEYSTTVSETGLVTFTFTGINLAWKSSYGDALSSASVQYSIQRKTTAVEGTEFTNTANIYFDYNAPITTNTTLNTLRNDVEGLGESEMSSVDAVTVDLFPVPVTDQLTIRVNNISNSQSATVSVIDLAGHVVVTGKVELGEGSTSITKDLSKLMAGTYLTRVELENGAAIVKKVVLYR